jgi:hypothetical protein
MEHINKKKWEVEDLKDLLEKQYQRLVKLGLISMIKEKGKDKVLDDCIKKASHLITTFSSISQNLFSDVPFPILLVIPEKIIPLQIQLQTIRWVTNFYLSKEVIDVYEATPCVYQPEKIINIVSVPIEPYLIYNVSYGIEREENGKYPIVKFVQPPKGTRPLTAAEGIALFLQAPHILENASLAFASSRYEDSRCIPVLHLYRDVHPEIVPRKIDALGSVLVPYTSGVLKM